MNGPLKFTQGRTAGRIHVNESHRHGASRALMGALLLAMGAAPAMAEEPAPLDFDPGLLLESQSEGRPVEVRGAAPKTAPVPTQNRAPAGARPPAVPQAASVETLVIEPDGRYPAAAPAIAPLHGDLLEYVAEKTAAWSVRAGETLEDALRRWATEAGWSLVWRAGGRYVAEVSMTYPPGTTFREAARETIGAYWRENPSLRAEPYRNKVLVVSDAAGSKGDAGR